MPINNTNVDQHYRLSVTTVVQRFPTTQFPIPQIEIQDKTLTVFAGSALTGAVITEHSFTSNSPANGEMKAKVELVKVKEDGSYDASAPPDMSVINFIILEGLGGGGAMEH